MPSGPTRSEMGAQRRLVLVVGLLSLVALLIGLLGFLHFEPLGQHSGLRAHVVGVFPVDPTTGQVAGRSATTYRTDQAFAAVVDWPSLPPDVIVAAHWYDSTGTPVGGVGPGSVAQLSGQSVVGTWLEARGRPNLPGAYVFAVERWSGGRPVEVLGRSAALVVGG